MIPRSFTYRRAESVEHSLELLERCDDAKLLAGGHSLVPLMKLRFAEPGTLIDIGRLRELSYVRSVDGQLAIGALTRYHDLQHSELVRHDCPVLAEAAALVGDPQVRHCGTIGGSVAHGDPASDIPTVLVALDAQLVLRESGGQRVVAAREFFTGFLATLLSETELLVEVRVPRRDPGTGASYVKFNRRSQDWATVGVAVVVKAEAASIGSASIALTNMGSTPVRAREAEAELKGAPLESDRVQLSGDSVTRGTSPPSDTSGSAVYRAHLARVLARRALKQALADATARPGV